MAVVAVERQIESGLPIDPQVIDGDEQRAYRIIAQHGGDWSPLWRTLTERKLAAEAAAGRVHNPPDWREGLFTTGEAGALLGITDRAVRNWIADGALRGERDGRKWLVVAEDVRCALQLTHDELRRELEEVRQ